MELCMVLSLAVVLLGFFWWKVSRPKAFPPGPLSLPLFGNILQVDFSNPLKDMTELSKVYGPVYSIYLGSTLAVVVSGIKAIKEVLVVKGHEYADRPQNRVIRKASGEKGLVVAPYGRAWKEHRRFTLSTLRDFGQGKSSMDDRVAEESVYLLQEFKKNKDILYDPHSVVNNAVSNIICTIVFGRRYEYNDTTFSNILQLVHKHMKRTTGFWANLYNVLGLIHYLPLPHQKLFGNMKSIFAFLENVLEEHKSTRVLGEPRDYIDCYLEELDKERKEGNNKQTFDYQNLFACVVDLFVAGSETTSASLEWALLYMMAFPKIQEKCRSEIDKIRRDRDWIDYGDRVKMPYTQAVLQEVQRFASVLPLGLAHSVRNDERLNGFSIPKGTVIITDLYSLHHDETYWKYPHEFNPENFLSDDGELLKTESFLPFSAGPRICLGENLARMEVFLFFTTLLTHFEFHWPDPLSPPDLTPVFGVAHTPKRFKIRLVSRK
ncbi:cytochrome P450 2J6-like [Pelobates cultripes]|uniref:Cytochrome P450 2J6-like n=1 Tax=Pelobates cultripes TaxID=61616 RepID=A0AAD1TDC3_PELCU|nr:cytochrome P450 2J6-like [Pelobates cultripes]